MKLADIKGCICSRLYSRLEHDITELRPAQEKAIDSGLLEGKSLLVCTPTASGKTLIAELAMMNNIYKGIGKAVYIVPLKALASEKYRDFKNRYPDIKVALSIGDSDSSESRLSSYDLIVLTSEKLDSLIKHHAPWLRDVKTVVIDEIHLLNDPSRGPTLEILITLLRKMLKNIQLVGLSATIGNPFELSDWLSAEPVLDEWRPVELKKGVVLDSSVEFG
ncbi:DEAD/DEAH box helicase [Candidatus Woesearchaeota archaeon]|nr:DEAD/DEAH box helicase [Candidatus Woesearchaeota archaeon]